MKTFMIKVKKENIIESFFCIAPDEKYILEKVKGEYLNGDIVQIEPTECFLFKFKEEKE